MLHRHALIVATQEVRQYLVGEVRLVFFDLMMEDRKTRTQGLLKSCHRVLVDGIEEQLM
jgi:hypothetical protein